MPIDKVAYWKDLAHYVMDREQAIELVKKFKGAIKPIIGDAKVMLFGSYAKGCARPESDIDVAVIVKNIDGNWLTLSSALWRKTMDVDTLIEPVLLEESHPSPLYEDVLRTGIAV